MPRKPAWKQHLLTARPWPTVAASAAALAPAESAPAGVDPDAASSRLPRHLRPRLPSPHSAGTPAGHRCRPYRNSRIGCRVPAQPRHPPPRQRQRRARVPGGWRFRCGCGRRSRGLVSSGERLVVGRLRLQLAGFCIRLDLLRRLSLRRDDGLRVGLGSQRHDDRRAGMHENPGPHSGFLGKWLIY